MAEPLKDFYDRRRVARLGAEMAAAWPGFPRARFEREASGGLEALELLPRARHIAAALARALPADYPEALAVLLRALGPPLDGAEGHGMAPFHHLPHTMVVAERGLGRPDLSLPALREMTRRCSCEFAIRPFLEAHPEATMAALAAWARDPDEHVRRLVSEGTRPRLPWAPRLRRFQQDPGPALALLEGLKDDPSAYVRRSVANHLNDVAKDHREVALATCRRWLRGASPERRKLVVHALRTLVKAGHPEAIHLAGGDGEARFHAEGAVAPARPRIGEAVRCTLRLRNDGPEKASALLALRVHFVKARGTTSPRVFRLRRVTLAAGASATVARTVSLAQHTTRTHHPGEHRVEALVNGRAVPLGSFTLRPARGPGRSSPGPPSSPRGGPPRSPARGGPRGRGSPPSRRARRGG